MKPRLRAGRTTRTTVAGVGLAGVAATALVLAGAGIGWADYGPQPGDVVGVGGDSAQYALQFLADGDYNGDAGFNATGDYNRLVTFNATADANGSAFTSSVGTGTAAVPLDPTVVLRAGMYPVQRISSDAAAFDALLADSKEVINFIFTSSLPTSAQQTQASDAGWQYLHVVEIGTDSIGIAVDQASTNVPSGGLSLKELLSIYDGTFTRWNQLPGNSGGSSDTIAPLLPPKSSSVYQTFMADLTAANGGTAPTLGDVQTVDANDPAAITDYTTPADAIMPFSAGLLALWNDGYFRNPATAFPGSTTPLTAGVTILPGTGTAGDGNPAYSSPITDYVIFRQSDASSTTPMEPGGTRNWVQTLFSDPGGPEPFAETSAGQALIAAAGITPDYADLGDVT